MNFYLIFVICLACFQKAARAEVAQGSCSCAVFEMLGNEPLIEHTLGLGVACDDKGADTCRQLCIALAQSVKDKADNMICEQLNRHIENLKVGIYFKSCETEWKYTGLQSEKPINCHDGKVTLCMSTNV